MRGSSLLLNTGWKPIGAQELVKLFGFGAKGEL
jgi:hypothetical protein